MIIDNHMHIENESPHTIYAMERAAGVDRAVCWSIWMDSRESNERTKRAWEAYPDFFIPWGHVRPDDEYWPDELKRIVTDYKWTGLKLHFGEFRNRTIHTIDDFRYHSERDLASKDALIEIVAAAQSYDLPVLIDPVGMYPVIAEVAERCTKAPIIIPHLGSGGSGANLGAFCELTNRLAHVYMDVSFMHVYRHVQTAYELVGADKLIWGSDGYWMDPSVELAKLSVVSFASDQDREKVVWRNIAKILKLPEA
jgi:hypothetical protein